MALQKKIKILCPNCHFLCKTLNPSFEKTISCKACKSAFQINSKLIIKQARQFGDLAVKYKIIDNTQARDHISELLAELNTGNVTTLENHLLEKNVLLQNQVNLLDAVLEFLNVKQLDITFCKRAVEKGFTQSEKTSRALKDQEMIFKTSKITKLTGQLLIDSGDIDEKQYQALLAEQGRINLIIADPENDTSGTEEDYGTIEITISEDALMAFLKITGKLQNNPSVKFIQSLLKEHGIEFGIADNKSIANFLQQKNNRNRQFTVARGIPATPGKDAFVEYFFNTEYYRPGTSIADTHAPKIKDSSPPKVKSQVLLAQKTVMVQGRGGKTVLGAPILPNEVRDAFFNAGNGTSLSDDGLGVISTSEGQPIVSIEGKIHVMGIHKISGNASLNRGPLDFNSHVYVSGEIPNDVIVKGGHVTAEEIRGARIDVIGNIDVEVGITDAIIKTQGNVKARYIRNSKIDAFGDIFVENEIIDCSIMCSGICQVKNSRIISSEVSAKKGVSAAGIGSDRSDACTINAGASNHIERIVQELNDTRAMLKNTLADLEGNYEKLYHTYGKIQYEINGLKPYFPYVNDAKERAPNGISDMDFPLDESKSKPVTTAKPVPGDIPEEEKVLVKKLTQYVSAQKKIIKKRSTLLKKIEHTIAHIENLADTKAAYREWSQQQKGNAIIECKGPIAAGTIVSGLHATLKVKKDYRNILFKEVQISQSDPAEWEIKVIEHNG